MGLNQPIRDEMGVIRLNLQDARQYAFKEIDHQTTNLINQHNAPPTWSIKSEQTTYKSNC